MGKYFVSALSMEYGPRSPLQDKKIPSVGIRWFRLEYPMAGCEEKKLLNLFLMFQAIFHCVCYFAEIQICTTVSYCKLQSLIFALVGISGPSQREMGEFPISHTSDTVAFLILYWYWYCGIIYTYTYTYTASLRSLKYFLSWYFMNCVLCSVPRNENYKVCISWKIHPMWSVQYWALFYLKVVLSLVEKR